MPVDIHCRVCCVSSESRASVVIDQFPVFDDITASPSPVRHPSRRGVDVQPDVIGWQGVPMSISGGRGPRRDRKAGKEAGRAPRASLGRSRGRPPSPPAQSVPAVVNAENSSPSSSKTRLFIGSGPESSWMTAPSGPSAPSSSLSPSSRSAGSSRSRWSVTCVRCRHTPRGSSASVSHGPAGHMPHTGQQRAGSRGSGKPSSARPAGSTW
jgi:hypothetical protein